MSQNRPQYEFLKLETDSAICTLTLNNAKKSNAINETMWKEIRLAFEEIDQNKAISVCILKSDAKHFSSGIDINFLSTIMDRLQTFPEEEREAALYKQIKLMQASMDAVQKCRVPVIAAIHGICVGGALDLVAACDIRLATYTAVFSILETKLGIVADMGSLQRLTRIISDSHLKQLALSSDFFSGYKAKQIQLVSANALTKTTVHKKAYKLAKKISSLPTHAVAGSKQTINFARDHSIDEGLEQITQLNSKLLLSDASLSQLEKLKQQLKK